MGEAVGVREGVGDGRNEGAPLREGRAVGEKVGARVAADGATVGLWVELAAPVVNSRNSLLLSVSGWCLSCTTSWFVICRWLFDASLLNEDDTAAAILLGSLVVDLAANCNNGDVIDVEPS